MHFNRHSNLQGKHAFLSASKYHWINYEEDKLDRVFFANREAHRGIELHELAHRLIRLGVELPDEPKTLNMYVNDAISFQMNPEQVLYYSDNAFGTADAVSYSKRTLRIHDLKNGVNEASMSQLMVYASFFCLEYDVSPLDIDILLRIYQNDEIRELEADPGDVLHIMDKIVTFNDRIEELKMEVP